MLRSPLLPRPGRPRVVGKSGDKYDELPVRHVITGEVLAFTNPTLDLKMTEEHLAPYVKLAEDLRKAYNLEPLPEEGSR